MATITVHPAVFADVRHAVALEQTTGRRILFDAAGIAHLEDKPAPQRARRITNDEAHRIMTGLRALLGDEGGAA